MSIRLLVFSVLTTALVVVSGPAAHAAPSYAPPPVNAQFDYQLGGAYPPPAGVQVVTRDRTAAPAAGLYNICYINAFQTQPEEIGWWQQHHDNLLLRDAAGDYVVDGDWGENLLDTSTAAKRSAIATILNGWIDGCASAGYKAIEPDNQDSYDRSDGLLTKDGALALLRLLAPHAHQKGLAIAQKNTTDFGSAGKAAGLDFAVAEECQDWDECGDYTAVYGNHVIVIEYTKSPFKKACKAYGATLTIVLRDVLVTPPGSKTYQYDAC
jgi:hypothetical protein